jgi:hypothetical protein
MSKLAKTIYSFVIPLFTLLLTSCSAIKSPDQPKFDQSVTLDPLVSIGQTFLAEYGGLEGIDIFLTDKPPPEGEMHLTLYSDPAFASTPVATASIYLSEGSSSAYTHFTIPAQTNSTNQDYYIEITLEDADAVQLGSASGDTYLNGALYENRSPTNGQLVFNLSYNPIDAVMGLLKEVLNLVIRLLISIFLFILPGWALSHALLPNWINQPFWEKLAMSAGVSLCVYPVLYLVTHLFGLHLGKLSAWLPGAFALIYLAWKNISVIRETVSHEYIGTNIRITISKIPRQVKLVDWVLILTLIFIIFTRFFPIRILEVPMWGDSYQHTMITQLLADNKGLFDSWQPYAPLTTFTYHFGFHTLAASFHWLTGLSPAESVLWTGQILNLLAILCLYPLATRIGSSKWAGVIAITIAGLLLPMPMAYLNWGRYTQLAALVILPIAVWIIWELFDAGSISLKGYLLSWIVLSGLALTHYRILFFLILFFPAYIIAYGSKMGFLNLVKQTIYMGIGGGVLFLPWFIHVFGGKVMVIFQNQITTPADQTATVAQQTNIIGDLSIYLPQVIWILLPFILLWGLWRRDRGIITTLLWWMFILLAANPQWLGLPGAGAITNFAVFISLYIPASILLGSGLIWVINHICRVKTHIETQRFFYPSLKSVLPISMFVLLLLILLWGAGQRLADFRPDLYTLVTRPDRRAYEWIKTNSGGDSRILVNSFPAYGGYAIAGSDGGWWVPLLAERETNLPPLNYSFEQGPWPGYRQWVNELTTVLIDKGVDDPDVLAMLSERRISHVYIGQRGGRVGYDGPLILDPIDLQNSPNYQPIYHQDRVWIFELNPQDE